MSSPSPSRYVHLSAGQWAALATGAPLPWPEAEDALSEGDLAAIRGAYGQLSLPEATRAYFPLAGLLHLHITARHMLHRATQDFLGHPDAKVPFVIGIAGSVAVGKSTTARILKVLLSRWPDHPRVDLVTTDGFLHPNAELERRGLMMRKGFPESYDRRRLVQFLSDVKSGLPEVIAPIYDHHRYDIVSGGAQTVANPDILILEGLNVLQIDSGGGGSGQGGDRVFVSDLFDFSIYVDATEADLGRWFAERFIALCAAARRDPTSFFHRWAELDEQTARNLAGQVWASINAVNLKENIRPTRDRADLVLTKGAAHEVVAVHLRKL